MLGQMTTASGERKRQSLMEEKKKIEHGGLTRIECAQLGISFSGLRASVSCSCRLLMEAEKLGQGRGEKAVKGKNQITQFGSLFVRKRDAQETISGIWERRPLEEQLRVRISTQKLMVILMNPLSVNLDFICSIQIPENFHVFKQRFLG